MYTELTTDDEIGTFLTIDSAVQDVEGHIAEVTCEKQSFEGVISETPQLTQTTSGALAEVVVLDEEDSEVFYGLYARLNEGDGLEQEYDLYALKMNEDISVDDQPLGEIESVTVKDPRD